MRKALLGIAALGLLLATSCSKSSTTTNPTTNPATSTIPIDGWKLDATKYTQATVVRQESQKLVNAINGTTGSVHTFGAFFKDYPTPAAALKL